LEGDESPFTASVSESSTHREDSELALLESSELEDFSCNSQEEWLTGCEGDILILMIEDNNFIVESVA
jgi:hypothetical protein